MRPPFSVHCNPGNIVWGAFARKYGATSSDDAGFAVFPSMIKGLRAQAELLIAYALIPDGKGGLIDTVDEIINRWCPKKGEHGETSSANEAYKVLVCTMLDCDRNDEFDIDEPNFLFWMMTAQGEEEQGHKAFSANVTDSQIEEAIRIALAS